MFIDSHTHLDMTDFDTDRDQVLERASQAGISHLITVGIDLSSSMAALELANRNAFIFSTVGYHPHNATEMDPQNLEGLNHLASEPKVIAWGEIGLDFYRSYSAPEKQVEAFQKQLEMAISHALPVIIHEREAHDEILEILQGMGRKGLRGVVHCFSGDYDLAMAFIRMGFLISFPGTVTYKNALQVQDVASRIPLEYMLLETDAPFLSPVPKRGKRNEPSFVIYTAEKIAQLRHIGLEELARRTSENAKKLFNLPDLKTEKRAALI